MRREALSRRRKSNISASGTDLRGGRADGLEDDKSPEEMSPYEETALALHLLGLDREVSGNPSRVDD